ncbi:unnamed protein product [Colias eurytheme]|nr:unnamed protein product [Colias eurytheme]
MKFLVILSSLVALCAGHAIPTIPGDNSHYVEGVSRYVWIPDGEGVPRLVDLEEPADESSLDARNGADNDLGAHIIGNAGRIVRGQIGRITGLDPAGPQWSDNPNVLNRNDGVYVENIHTDGGLLGIFDPIGDADFYPNGGTNRQPGCSLSSCSHGRAFEFFASSIRYNGFNGRRCANLDEARNNKCTGTNLRMGNTDFSKRGSGLYGLSTGSEWPF